MKISWNWLRELVQLPSDALPADPLAAAREVEKRLIRRGVAVDAVVPVGIGLSGAIVAEVRGKRPHPKADKLTLVDVFDGQTVTQVVCGAPNVPAAGEPGSSPRVVWAKPGATLPSGLTLSVREVRGIPSPGMLCAEDELGLSSDHGGILILSPDDGLAIGSDFALGAGLPDVVFELDITPNRPDLLGHLGVAREVVAAFAREGATLTLPQPDFSTRSAAGGWRGSHHHRRCDLVPALSGPCADGAVGPSEPDQRAPAFVAPGRAADQQPGRCHQPGDVLRRPAAARL